MFHAPSIKNESEINPEKSAELNFFRVCWKPLKASTSSRLNSQSQSDKPLDVSQSPVRVN